MPSLFNFVEKEGKHFAPIVNTITNYEVQNGDVVPNGNKVVSGTRGVFAKVKMTLTGPAAQIKGELFAVNTEAFKSSS